MTRRNRGLSRKMPEILLDPIVVSDRSSEQHIVEEKG